MSIQLFGRGIAVASARPGSRRAAWRSMPSDKSMPTSRCPRAASSAATIPVRTARSRITLREGINPSSAEADD